MKFTITDARIPGWKMVTYENKSRRYISPWDNLSVGDSTYRKFYKHYAESGIMPKKEELPATARVFGSDDTEPKQAKENIPSSSYVPSTSGQPAINDSSMAEPEELLPFDMPEAKSKPGRSSVKSANSKELSTALQFLMLISTSVIAMAVSIPDITVTETEAKAIAIPLANILEPTDFNKKFGRYIVGTNDYGLLGYALYAYLYRVSSAVREKRNAVSRPGQATQPATSTGNSSSGTVPTTGAGTNGAAPLRFSSEGIRGFTPLTGAP